MTTTTDTFAGAPVDLRTRRYAALADIPVEFFISIPKWVFHPKGTLEAFPNLNSDAMDLALVGGPSLDLLRSMAGFTIDQDTGATTHVSTGVLVGTIDASGMNAVDQFNGAVSITVPTGNTAVYDALAGNTELVIPNCTRLQGNWLYQESGLHPGGIYTGFRPMTDLPYADQVFVDNLGFTGFFSAQLDLFIAAGDAGVVAGTRDYFTGMLKRSAIGKTAAALVAADITMGVLAQGGDAYVVVNGAVVWTRSDLPQGNDLELYFDATPTTDQSSVPPDQLGAVGFDIFAYASGDFADFGTITPFSGSLPVSMAESVFATVRDLDMAAATGATAIGSTVNIQPWNSDETAYGAFYEAGPVPLFWTNRIRTSEVI